MLTEISPDQAQRTAISSVPTGLFIGGQWRATVAELPVLDPATGQVLCTVADASPADGLDALAAAADAQAEWARTPARDRADLLMRAHQSLLDDTERLALVMTLEMGKPLAEARGEIAYAAEFFRWFAEEAVRIEGGYRPAPRGGSRFLVTRQPVGPSLLITPWNFPMAMGTRKIGPALAAGCTCVIKPAAQTPLSTLALAEILRTAGLPDGVVNVVTTSDPGAVMEPMIRDSRSRKLSFTGSTAVGKKLLEQCAHTVMRTSMELGGNAAFLVFDDADLDAAVEGAMAAKMRNIGQACTAANRFLVHRSIAVEFADRLTARMAGLPMGPGIEPGVVVGPLVDEAAVAKVQSLVDDAIGRGATVRTGGTPIQGPGNFYPATVLTDVGDDALLTRTEIFGPVAAISVFDTEDEAVTRANDTPYGLVGYVFTENLRRGLRVCEALETGMVGLNRGVVSDPAAPFGGVKESGLGREGGTSGIDEFLETKYIGVDL
ncbi:NAD-dependent succinate-semialdehyde dehydrogenase [Nocardia cyriacigeorgica]|uniref:NAD-dependent succinate-semialdehyde dehydrogenase n=3 Tax=Nocardia TaxID=1817 RepID=A0A6P1CEP4_9NOCA|nr:NAD-dependent succinate-semialdehyde dehydrogenase [Nocardia cyriacigeorgica]MBF6423780.1 NAD-dependent succinate-semialdehyde dehydrogenase [Nocardia cyriacigeorgica]NEW31091.1 NAD-dependent succinate-semialdehyde dehydrogenase [Nocardia cyriacigeorgica]CCF64525.1 putative succinate-semialdehyde dehydrogenase [NADP+] (SSDH) [Nocardia cyriacigeorgica GUH-2]BDT88186.1 NAD-dependent succinate-semialdehyde dehydrogenase [Nocardia cyriacigeorgica]BDU07596.1 NAD-dependent succinate-semialdehyde 